MNQDKVVLITGASTGIGRATAHEFAKKGFKLAIHGRDASVMSKVVEECDKFSPNANKVSLLPVYRGTKLRVYRQASNQTNNQNRLLLY